MDKPFPAAVRPRSMEAISTEFANPAAAEAAETDASLVEAARKGDMRAFEQLYRKHCGRINALCLRMAGDPHTAEECVQDAFVKAWEALPKFRGDAAFGTWLYRIAANTVLARHRTRLRRAAWVENDESALEMTAAHAAPTGLADDIEQAIATLPDGARIVFVLYAVEGYKHEEIAEMTGLAIGTSKAQLHRARRLLQARLET